MECEISLHLLEQRIDTLKQELEEKIGGQVHKLSSPEVLKVNRKIDEFIITYMKLQLVMKQ